MIAKIKTRADFGGIVNYANDYCSEVGRIINQVKNNSHDSKD